MAAGQHPPEGEAQLQEDVTEPAGTVNDAGKQDEGEFKPARAENDAMHNDPAAKDAPTPGEPVDMRLNPLTLNHPKFDPMPDAQRKGDYDKSSRDPDMAEQKIDQRAADLDAREKEVITREAEVSRREKAAQPAIATITDRDVDEQIVGESYVDGATAFGQDPNLDDDAKKALGGVTLCAIRLRNGGVMIGTAEADGQVASDPQGLRSAARADARQQLDAAHRYAHRNKVAGGLKLRRPARWNRAAENDGGGAILPPSGIVREDRSRSGAAIPQEAGRD